MENPRTVQPVPRAFVRDIGIYYEEHGAGRPLLLIGGLGGDLALYRGLIAGFARTSRVIAFDNRGAGRSDKPDEPYSVEMLALDALALMDALNIACADLLGISMGGRIALEIAAKHPGRVHKLVLVSTSAAGTGRIRMSIPMRLLGLGMKLPGLRARDSQPDYAHRRQRQAATSYDGHARLARICTPTLIAHGRNDRSIPLASAKQLHSGIAGSRLHVYKGGHMFSLLTQRDAFIDEVTAFLQD